MDVLSGLLSGSRLSPSVGPLYDDFHEPMGLGHFVAAIDIETFREVNGFKDEIGRYIDQLKATETRKGFDEVKLPGEIETEQLHRHRESGIELRGSTVESIRSVADVYDVPFPDPIE